MINKVKEFINMKDALKSAGVIGLSMFDNDIHVNLPVLAEMPNVQFESVNDVEYPFKAVVMVDGIKLFSMVHKDDVSKFSQLEGYMIEDVNFDGEADAI